MVERVACGQGGAPLTLLRSGQAAEAQEGEEEGGAGHGCRLGLWCSKDSAGLAGWTVEWRRRGRPPSWGCGQGGASAGGPESEGAPPAERGERRR